VEMTIGRLGTSAALALCLACGGGDVDVSGCRANLECQAPLVCVVPSAGQSGTCQKVPVQVALTSPGPGALVGKDGIDVTAQVTLGAADANAPSKLLVLGLGDTTFSLPRTARDGAQASYAARYVPPPGASFEGPVEAAIETTAGFILSDGVHVTVDAKPPALSVTDGARCFGVAVCPRDGQLHIGVSLSEDRLDTIGVTLDLDQDVKRYPLVRDPLDEYSVDIPLADYAFPTFSANVRARVRAKDTTGNETILDMGPVPVTRLRWGADLRPQQGTQRLPLEITGAAVDGDRNALVGGSDGKLHVIAPDGSESGAVSIGGSAISAAPSIGASTVWVASEDGKLYGRQTTGSIFPCPSTGATPGAMFTPAILFSPSEDAYSAGAAAKLNAASESGCLAASGVTTTDPTTTAAAISGGSLFLATSRAARSTIHRFSSVPSEELSAATSCGTIAAPPAVDVNGDILVACAGGEIAVIDKSTLAGKVLRPLPDAAQESIVITASGDLVVGANDGKVHRLTPPASPGTWTETWSPAPDLGSPVTGTLIASATAASDPLVYATTSNGELFALSDAGEVVWSTSAEPTPPLGAFALTFPTIAPADSTRPGALPTLYVGSADGKLYAVVVDNGLDTTSPWPKSHHDIRNTGNAEAPLP
jgi:outer membrane protein assembly factor BamB